MLRPRTTSLLLSISLLAGCSRFAPDTPLDIPIRFEDGFSLTHDFTTHRAKRYELIVAFHKTTTIKPTGPEPDEFTTDFRISSGGATVVEGTNDSDPRRPAFLSRDYTARQLAVFPGQPGQRFQLSFPCCPRRARPFFDEARCDDQSEDVSSGRVKANASNQALERTTTRFAFTLCVAKAFSFRATLAPGGRRSALLSLGRYDAPS